MHLKPVISSSPTHQRVGAIKSASVLRLQKAISRAHLNVTAVPHARRASHPEYPLERTCSLLSEPFQLTFARNAKLLFCERDDLELVASHQGLTVRAETEDVIDAAVVVVKDLYGQALRLGPLTIRLHQGVTVEQPWMGLRVRCIPDHLEEINADLIARNARVIGCEVQSGLCTLQASAPLGDLLGYRAALVKLTLGSAQHAMWLSHYAPVEELPPDGHAA
jgi:hypothetical protein